MLNTLTGVGQQTTTNLKMQGIVKFLDVIGRSPAALEAASMRPPPFGTQLKSAVQRILDSALKLSAHVQSGDGAAPDHCVVSLEARNPMNFSGRPKCSNEQAVVTYTLVAYTDKPGSCLYYQEEITNPEDIKFLLPNHFGLLVIQLVASMVGLDG